jgi:hypothetical protein
MIMSRYSTFACVAFALAASVPACSKSEPYYLLVNVSLDPNLPQEPDSVKLTAKQNQTEFKRATLSWSLAKAGVLEVGLALPSDTTIPVVVTGVAFLGINSVGQGTATLKTIIRGQNSDPISLVIYPFSGTAGDGGVPDAATDATGGSDGASSDATGGTDVSGTDASATSGTDGAPAADAAPDGAGADSALDAPFTSKDAPVFDTSSEDGSVADGASDDAADDAGRQWSSPLNLQNHASTTPPTPAVAVSPTTGDAVVVWYDDSVGIRAAHYTAASNTWAASPVTLESRGKPLSVQVAVDGNGHYVAVWVQDAQTPSLLGVWASYSSDGVTWSNPPVLLAAGPSNADYGDVRLAVNRAGQGWVVWDQTVSSSMSSSDPEWVYSAFLSVTTAKAPVIVKAGTTDGEARYRQPRVAIDSKGNGLVVWTELEGNPAVRKNSTWAAALADGTKPSPQLIESYDGDLAFGADVAMNAAGQAVAIWAEQRQSGGDTLADIFARRYSVTSGWDPEPPRLYAASYAGNLSVDEDRFGTVGIGWSQPTSGLYQAMFSTQALGGTWSTSAMESDDHSPGSGIDIEPQVRTALDSGDLLMAWRKRLDDGNTFAPQFCWRSNGKWGAVSDVGTIQHLYASKIHIGVADNGRAVAAWTYYHCYYDINHPEKCTDTPSFSPPANTIANVFVAVYK